QDQIRADHALLTIRALVSNDSTEESNVRLWVELLAKDGHVVAYGARNLALLPASETEVLLPIQLDDPVLWEGIANPYLYEVQVSLEGYNDKLDELHFRTGLRRCRIDPQKGFLLNGKPYRLNGVCRHQDRRDVGWAISREDQQEDMDCIKEIGANAVRLTHYQHDPFFYELCDREGIIVWTEIPFITRMSETDATGANAKQQLVELIRQNINHPSICFWGIQNEIQISGENPAVRKLVSELNALAKFEDSTRLTTMANLMTVPIEDSYNTITDAVGYNRYDGWYAGEMSDLGVWLDDFHAQQPGICLGISEYGVDGILQYHSENPVKQDYTEEFQALYHETIWQIIKDRPWVWGSFVWNMFDFASSIRNEGGIRGRNNKGLVTYGRYLRKDAFYFYKAQWSAEKFVYITGRRFIERTKNVIDLKVYTNCEWVELTVNHSEFARISGEGGVVTIKNVPLFKGYNLITATGYLTGEVSGTEVPINRKSQAVFMRVEKPNPSYEAPAESRQRQIPIWFRPPTQ
ncbi:MAG: glycoside hydrolase family 2 protein, partial [Ruminococcaceae bacterium]|nr:glycoside hydrolase family 2 protein [Oscillospiraceae bacterium]